MSGSVFGEFALLYRNLARIGVPPPVADGMELWQVAAVLGIADAPAPEPELTGTALLRERMRRHRAGLPPLTTEAAPSPELRRLVAVTGG